MQRETKFIVSTLWSDDGKKQVNLYINGIAEFLVDSELVKTVDLSYLTNQELEARAEEFIRLN